MAAMPATSARAVAIDRPACPTRLSTNALTSAALAGMAGTPAAAAQRVHAVHARRYVRRVFRDQAAVRSSAASAASSPRAARVMRAAACAASTPGGQGRQVQARPAAAQRVSGHPGSRACGWWWPSAVLQLAASLRNRARQAVPHAPAPTGWAARAAISPFNRFQGRRPATFSRVYPHACGGTWW